MQRYTFCLFLETAVHSFRWYLHQSSGAHTTLSTASDTCKTVIATCRYRGGVGTQEVPPETCRAVFQK
jgi:hypothetical protein